MQPAYQVSGSRRQPRSPTPFAAIDAPVLEANQGSELDPTVTLLTDFENHLCSLNISPLTIKYYLAVLLGFLQWFLQTNGEELIIDRITPANVRICKQHLLKEENLNAASMKRQMAALSTITKWARQTEQVQTDMIRRTPTVEPIRHNHRWLDREQQAILIDAIENDLQFAKNRYPRRWLTRHRDATLTIFLLHTGLRLVEVVRLQTSDIQISINQSNASVRHGQTSRQRVVPLNNEAQRALQDWYAVRPQSRYLWTVPTGNHDKALSGRAVQRILNRYAKTAKIDGLTPVVCRHTFARNLVNSGVRLENVAALLGLSSLDATRIYAAPNDEDLEQAAENQSVAEMKNINAIRNKQIKVARPAC